MTPGENWALLAKEEECWGVGDGQYLPCPSQFPLLPSQSTKKTKNFRVLQTPACPPTPSIIPPATSWIPAPLNSPLFFQNLPLCLDFLSQQMATPSICLRQKGGWLPRLSPSLTFHIPSSITSFITLQAPSHPYCDCSGSGPGPLPQPLNLVPASSFTPFQTRAGSKLRQARHLGGKIRGSPAPHHPPYCNQLMLLKHKSDYSATDAQNCPGTPLCLSKESNSLERSKDHLPTPSSQPPLPMHLMLQSF